jgi:hypothetical protein
MDHSALFTITGPALFALAAAPSAVSDRITAWISANPDWQILRVRGDRSRDEEHFMTEVAAVLQFPYYFGENWDAFWDCMRDLSWQPQPAPGVRHRPTPTH